MNFDELRTKIDAIDTDLVRLLNERIKVALDIGELKKQGDGEVYVPAREKEVLERVTGLNPGPLPQEAVRAIYREIMSASLALERDVQVAYLGPPATFTHQAARHRFGSSIGYVDCATISDVFAAVEKRTADYGVVPIENSTEGAVTHTLDEFIETPLKICAEIYLSIAHHLLAVGDDLRSIERLYSNPQVFGQCRRWLQEHMPHADLVSVSSTARAAEMAAKDRSCGALASALAAELHDLNILAADIQDLGGNTTRFLVLGKEYGAPTGMDKSSICFAVQHKAGALYEGLEAFKKCGINMTKIESRPSKSKAWEYYFFVDLEGHVDSKDVRVALDEISKHCLVMTILGSYPSATQTEAVSASSV